MHTSEVLNKAADLIEQRGWASGGEEVADPWGGGSAGTGPVCLEGGILAALGLRTDHFGNPPSAFRDCPAYKAVESHVNTKSLLWLWNDTPDRTASEVIEVLRACALIEAAREAQDAAWETYAEVVTA